MSQWNYLYSYLKQTKQSFSKNGEKKPKTDPGSVLVPVGEGGEQDENIMYSWTKMEKWD
jgi:hypothetical protein